jgi:hypothetical protein
LWHNATVEQPRQQQQQLASSSSSSVAAHGAAPAGGSGAAAGKPSSSSSWGSAGLESLWVRFSWVRMYLALLATMQIVRASSMMEPALEA